MNQLTSYLIDKIAMFKDFPIKAIDEIAGRLDQKIFDYQDIILKEGECSNELKIVY